MKSVVRLLAFVAFGFVAFAAPSSAQYVFLDSNGDAAHTAADQLNANGTATSVSLYVITDKNRDGGTATCNTADGNLTINSYVIALQASGGTVTFTGWANAQTGMATVLQAITSNTTDLTAGFGGGTINPPGKYLLMTGTITGTAGAPSINVIPDSPLSAGSGFTSFGTACSGNDLDNTYKLIGTNTGIGDFTDVGGLGAAPGGNLDPTITAPATASGTENSAFSVTASASDPEGANVTLSQTNNAAFLTGPASAGPSATPSITLTGTPDFTQAGSYTVYWSAADATTGTATASTAVTIANLNRNPVITAPATVSGTENIAISVTASSSDSDGENVGLWQTNNTDFLTGPATAGFSANPSITLSGTPDFHADGSYYTVIWNAFAGAGGTATAATTITIANVNRPPSIIAPVTISRAEGDTFLVFAWVEDPDGYYSILSQTNNAPFLTGPASAVPSVGARLRLVGTPTFSQAGSYTVNWSAEDHLAATATASTAITISNVNRCPVANAGGPYTGIIGFAVNFNGTASSDADGDGLTYSWDFGDCGSLGNGASPQYTYATAGTYTVTLTANDGTCSNTATTTASIVAEFPATVFTTGGNNTTSLGAGKPTTCVQIEAVGGSFANSDVDLTSIKMISVGTGSVSEIFAIGDKTASDGDKNQNGVMEIRACFTKADLRLLFSGLPAGRNMVTVVLEGNLTTGGKFRGTLIHTVKSNGAAPAASVSPNPLNPETTLSFQLRTPGRVTVKIFDLNGRLVKTLLDDTRGAGYQDLTWNGTNHGGAKVASGVYYFRLDTPDGRIVKAATVLK